MYEIELWSPSGSRIADISQLCVNRRYTLQRNEAETLTFSVGLFKFESFCAKHLGGVDPATLLAPYVTDVKVKRAGQYLFGVQVVDVSFTMSADSSSPGQGGRGTDFMVNITCTGYLNLFKDRYTSNLYTQVERTAIATDLITTTQAQTNGSVGVTVPAGQYATGLLTDRTYQRDNIKLKIQELAALSDSPFDFAFTWDKQFKTYQKLGARRQDLNFIYGGPLGNVAGFTMSRSGINLFNKVYGIGSGYGTDQLTSTQGDTASQLNYYLRETISQFNSVVLQPTLDQNTMTALSLAKDVLELPKVTITGQMVGKNFLSIGDRIPLQVQAHSWLKSVSGLYRIEQMDVSIDENDFEREIVLTFDNYGVNQSE
ncbi:hypothetical protein [Williamsia sterculiae]|uniref:hypothetical protein n=1 Tax=Williamsia sterculiae TaxID=1344003 RepID=UPI0013564C3D|nr:hypothetical protein [Williamsia sterculiae]